jgi:hypothetical protein
MKIPPACLACSEEIVVAIQPVFIRRVLGGHCGRQCGQVENLARYIIRASFSQERMSYIPEESEVIYRSKDGKEEKVFDALEWLAATRLPRLKLHFPSSNVRQRKKGQMSA